MEHIEDSSTMRWLHSQSTQGDGRPFTMQNSKTSSPSSAMISGGNFSKNAGTIAPMSINSSLGTTSG